MPSLAHKVWILDCTHCGVFITNRAMKAVLLLRPNVSLYSSDALPLNCSAHNAGPDPAPAAPSHKPSPSPAPARTCECLTQSLACHGCGTTIGYMIVNPCSRCTSSISATNRATNGHRFVFHSTEVTGTERYYVKGEPGVVPYDPPQYHHHPDAHVLPPLTSPRARPASPHLRADYLPTPPLEFATPHWLRHSEHDPSPAYYHHHPSRSPPPFGPAHAPSHSLSRRSNPTHPYTYPYPSPSPSSSDSPSPAPSWSPSSAYRPPTTRPRSRSTSRSRSPPPPPPLNNAYSNTSTSTHPADHNKDAEHDADAPPHGHPATPSLRPGDPLFWHHLARSGEIPGVADNKLARTPRAARSSSSAHASGRGPPPRRIVMRDVTFNR